LSQEEENASKQEEERSVETHGQSGKRGLVTKAVHLRHFPFVFILSFLYSVRPTTYRIRRTTNPHIVYDNTYEW